MQKYADYTPAQAAWLDELPSHWQCTKIGALFSERKSKVSDKDYAPLSVARIGVVPQLATAVKTDAGDNRKLNCTPFVRQYDILSKKWGVLLCQKEYQTNDIRRSSREWL